MLIERVYHPYWEWEEINYNMWGSVKNRKEWLKKAIDFTGDHLLYGRWMLKVVNDWEKSCEHNLSNKEQNRRAWIGHAAVAYAIGCPEDIVREAWSYLSEEQQNKANEQADKAISEWETNYAKA